MATKLDLADAQFVGWGTCKQNDNDVIQLVTGMGLTKKEWIKWKKEYATSYLDEEDMEAIDNHFNLTVKERLDV